jgi:secreted trypsin-like serine protease
MKQYLYCSTYRLLFLVTFLTLAANAEIVDTEGSNLRRRTRQQSRVVGGNQASANEYPFFVELGIGCGGSLVHFDLVLTAAHCVTGSQNEALLQKQRTVHVGGRTRGEGTTRDIVDIRVHPLYDQATGAYDMALMLLDWPVENTQPVPLNVDPILDENLLTVVGYGHTYTQGGQSSTTLQHAKVPYVQDCKTQYPSFRNRLQESSMFCAGGNGKDTCTGDSGGPILDENQQLVGVTSWGIGCHGNKPGVYASITAASDWIQQQQCQFSKSNF